MPGRKIGSLKGSGSSVPQGFTLVELLIVLAIIGILATLMFPVFARQQEAARQRQCSTNLQNIYLATRLYYDDEKEYPASLVHLLPESQPLADYDSGSPATAPNVDGTDLMKGSREALRCRNDRNRDLLHSSYGDISTNLFAGPATNDRLVWNYYGYNSEGLAYPTWEDARLTGVGVGNSWIFRIPVMDPANALPENNPLEFSLANRYAPTSTIITHCRYHRPQTARGHVGEDDIYLAGNEEAAEGARDLILRLDGSTRLLDVSAFKGRDLWRHQDRQ